MMSRCSASRTLAGFAGSVPAKGGQGVLEHWQCTHHPVGADQHVQAHSNFFQPPAYARWRSRSCTPWWAAEPRQMFGQR